MTSFEAYKLFVALKNHFITDYDYFKYKGKTNLTLESFEKRRDRFHFQKLANIKDCSNYIIANIINDNCKWVGDLLSEQGRKNYTNWQRYTQSISYNFENELSNLDTDFNKNFICTNNQYPILLKSYIMNKVSLESLIILDDLCDYIRYWKRNIDDSTLWPGILRKITKYKPFLHYDKVKLKHIVHTKFK